MELLSTGSGETDVGSVVHRIREWVTYRTILLRAQRETLRDMEQALRQERFPSEQQWHASECDVDDPYASVTEDEVEEHRAYIQQLQRDYDLVEHARLELEAQHPELHLEPFDVDLIE